MFEQTAHVCPRPLLMASVTQPCLWPPFSATVEGREGRAGSTEGLLVTLPSQAVHQVEFLCSRDPNLYQINCGKMQLKQGIGRLWVDMKNSTFGLDLKCGMRQRLTHEGWIYFIVTVSPDLTKPDAKLINRLVCWIAFCRLPTAMMRNDVESY